MPSKCYEVTVCQLRRSIQSFRHLSCWPSWLIVPLHGMVSAQPKIKISWSRSCEGASALATVRTILQPSKNYVLAASDAQLFQRVIANPQHTLHLLLPSESTITYDLRPHAHNFTLPDKHCALDSCNFITRMLYANCYWHCNCYTLFYSSFLSCLQLRFVICIINEELSWVELSWVSTRVTCS